MLLLAGEDDVFVSLYGCLDDRTTPTDAGSLIPEGFSVADLDLEEMPDPWDEEGDACASESAYDIAEVPTMPFYLAQLIPNDDAEVTAEWCSCIEEPGCNGAGAVAVKLFAVVMAAALAVIL